MIFRGDAGRLPFADKTFDLIMGSPPYTDARDYLEDGVNLGISRDTEDWITWMLGVTAEALRVSKGLVIWVCSGVTRGRNYQPAPEGLLYRWWAQGGECHCLRPVIWHRSGIPGSGGDQWFRADTEYCLAFKRPGVLPWADNVANGHTPKFAPGGEMSNRKATGERVNFNSTGGGSDFKSGNRKAWQRVKPSPMPSLANPGNLFSTGAAGGGNTGPGFALEGNEAPYPQAVPEWFIASHCPPEGRVYDPFSGSGTTVAAARSLGRQGVGSDLRQSQCRLSRKRIATVTPGFSFAETN